ncbi:prepilin-type N-terminal cleavage/methylation domain-containing protein [Sulfurimonas sp.]|uniref:type II secretion system protein n=1 Tax=Sulfurimonas sp. TaxID=2022749 RepID=UPI00260D517B|nr:prepilin-type N-terminal cleavage/methylation domain-containing protein [Sulfurimonas sp.]MCW8894800.1 prepilin-type N-terminal cleavage/methylation domain-containing protein [Sulfurimonas sp.]
MKQGSNMTVSHKGMRKGISLMEMLVAIILLGILSSVGFTYYKNYYSTALAAKQIKVAILLDQAAQLKNGLELYAVKTGVDANSSVADPADANNGLGLLVAQRIITSIPATIPDMSDQGWFVSTNTVDIDSTFIQTQGGTTLNEQFLTYDLNGTAVGSDRQDYCNALNNIASNGALSYDVVEAGLGADINASAELANNTFFCWDSDTGTADSGQQLVFLTKIQ